ncbi:uracil-DNA glycosylase-like [Diabrotica virgifera virgifera]|uniref:Uracil-DNA glycosylase-like domain-containing protein n=1 Tax=Diabrotica virgifera virgifera TaxID=50390 RepID=A0ABM5JWM4_DIAVI|nr:uracil-DNA glycosylase-like [Diabrotica virgifera virgifera]
MAQQTFVSNDLPNYYAQLVELQNHYLQWFNFSFERLPVLFSNSNIPDSWKPLLGEVFCTQFNQLNTIAVVLSYIRETDWFPNSGKLWSFTRFCSPADVKVVIIGQDPSDSDGTGLAFSKDSGIYPSTQNILEEVKSDIGEQNLRPEFRTDYGNLDYWAKQGVLLLNSALTNSTYKSHLSLGWNVIVEELIKKLQALNKNIVFMFWGECAKALRGGLENRFEIHYWNQYSAGHPSPNNQLNNFSGCKHFSQANGWLVEHDINPIDWCPVPPPQIVPNYVIS